MPIRVFECPQCREHFKSKKESPLHCGDIESVAVIVPPNVKLQETDSYTGKTQMQNQEKILKARARNHSRDNDLDDLVQKNDTWSAHNFEWLKDGGRKRKAIDDI